MLGSVHEWRVQVGGDEIRAVLDLADKDEPRRLFVFAHGAGGHMADRGMLALTSQFCARGLHVVRFNFPYRQKGGRQPDAMPRLQECIAAVASRAAEEAAPQQLIIGGRSMGGRAASMLAADRFACAGLLLLAYPLHPAGKPEKLRDRHLPRITAPVLCVNGTRDSLCRRALMDDVINRRSTNWQMHWLEGADHGFHVTKASGRTDADILDEIGMTTAAWLSSLALRLPQA